MIPGAFVLVFLRLVIRPVLTGVFYPWGFWEICPSLEIVRAEGRVFRPGVLLQYARAAESVVLVPTGAELSLPAEHRRAPNCGALLEDGSCFMCLRRSVSVS